jgi:hypothetical protein
MSLCQKISVNEYNKNRSSHFIIFNSKDNLNFNMSIDKKIFEEKVERLVQAYEANQTLSKPNPCECPRFSEIRNINNVNFYLTEEQASLKADVFDLIFPKKWKKSNNNCSLTMGYAKKVLDRYIFCKLTAKRSNINELYEQLSNPTVEKITVGRPITVNLLTRSSEIKIIDIVITREPKQYLYTNFPYGSGLSAWDSNMFCNPNLYDANAPQNMAAFSIIDALDQEQAKIKFDRNCKESMAFIRLFCEFGDMYLGTQKDEFDSYYFINNSEKSSSSSRIQNPNRIAIYDKSYQVFLDNGLAWLNEWNSHDDRTKAEKIKDALFWYYSLHCRLDVTKKLIYASTILETLLKNDNENIEIKTSIAERCAFLIASDKNTRKNTFDFINKMYSLRSKVIHNGYVLGAEFEYFIEEIMCYVKYSIIHSIKKLSNKNISFETFIEELKYAKFG